MSNLREELELPDDMWKEILFWLNFKELCKIGLVSKKFKEYSNDPYFWKKFIQLEGNSLKEVEENFSTSLSKNDKNYWKDLYIKSTEFEWIPDKYAKVTPDKKEYWNRGTDSNKIENSIVWACVTSKQSWSSGKHTFLFRIIRADQYGKFCSNTSLGFKSSEDSSWSVGLDGDGQLRERTISTKPKRTEGPPFQAGDLVKCTIDFKHDLPILTFENDNPIFKRKYGQLILPKKEPLHLFSRVVRGGDRIRLESIKHE